MTERTEASNAVDGALTSPLGPPAEIERIRGLGEPLESIVEDLERIITPEFHRADAEAIDSQRMIKRTRLAEICGGAIIATLAIIGLARDEWQWGALAGLIAGLTAVASAQRRSHELESWLDQRRIAEELRSLYFRMLTSPDASSDDGTERRRHIRVEVDSIVAPEYLLAAEDAATGPRDRGQRIDPATWGVYRTRRLEDQIEWMRGKSRTVERRSTWFGRAQTLLLAASAIAGLCIAVIEASGDGGGADSNGLTTWLGVLVAASAGLVSLAAAADTVVASERLSEHYDRTVRRLEAIQRSLDDHEGWTADVEHAEAVLLAEHRVWHRITKENNQ